MSGLFSLLGTGARSLMASQLAQATTGNNAANSTTPGFSRRRTNLAEGPTVRLTGGIFGTGVQAVDVTRLRDRILDVQRRLDGQELAFSKAQSGVLQQVEALFAPADSNALATGLNRLFAAFGDLAAHPTDPAVRQALVAEAQNFVNAIHSTRDAVVRTESGVYDTVADRVVDLNTTTAALAAVNAKVVTAQPDPSLQDEQDRLVDHLSSLIGVRATMQSDGTVQVVVDGSGIQLVDGPRATTVTMAGVPTSGTVSLSAGGATLPAVRGEIGGLLDMRNNATTGLPATLASLDSFAVELIQAINTVHASGTGLTLPQTVTGSVTVATPAANLSTDGLRPPPASGTIQFGVFDATGAMVSTSTLAVNPATTSLNALAAAISGLPNLTAAVVGGQLQISTTNPANQLAFGPDSTGLLAGLGVNGFLAGTDAASIAVSADVLGSANRIAAGQADLTAGVVSAGDNRNARALAALATQRSLLAGTQTPSQMLGGIGTAVGNTTRSATARTDAQQALVDADEARLQATSGVNLDEEMADMVRFQHAYEASARYIRTIDEMIQSLMGILR
ncbi:MAG: flagellar hook-associated protein FlgK [Candidatus Rokubacteria bacterium]|nr:flagellar hook-associated protein FlgK [Candidatus Rokubacteria bacterium]